MLALPTATLATSLDFGGFGNSNLGTASIVNVQGQFLLPGVPFGFSVVLDQKNGGPIGNYGTITFTTGPLMGSFSDGIFSFTGGNVTVANKSGVTIFSSVFSAGTVLVTPSAITVSGVGFAGVGATAVITFTQNESFTIISSVGASIAPEPGTLGLLGTGIIGLAGLVRQKMLKK
jgi:hypothetical protein